MQRRHELFPPLDPIETGMLPVDSLHRIYWERSGNPEGRAVLFLHGGPGSGTSPTHRRFFDPAFYKIILFDQRGAGRSEPFGALTDNTTPHLIADIEALRRHLGIERWLVFGGSWGSTLAIAYAEVHPERVAGLVLRGIFLCRPEEVQWFLYGMGTIFPEAWRSFSHFLPPEERGDLLSHYYRRLADPDPAIHMPAARAWSSYEGACSTLLPNPDAVVSFGDHRMALGLARIEAHYMMHEIFLERGQLLNRANRLKPIPGVIVQGRYDVVCPITTADALSRAWPEATYTIIPDAGHSAMEPGTRSALVGATDAMKVRAIW
jgi:proline iminopeptidase